MPAPTSCNRPHHAVPAARTRGRRLCTSTAALLFALGVAGCGGGSTDAPTLVRTAAVDRPTLNASAPADAVETADRASVAQVMAELTRQAQAAQGATLVAAEPPTGLKQAQALDGERTIPTLLPEPLSSFCSASWEPHCGTRDDKQVTTANGQVRDYVLWRPYTAKLRTQVPLVIMLHGTAQSGPQFFNTSGWREKAFREGVFVAFPSALLHCYHQDDDHDGTLEARHVLTKWAAGKLGTPERPLCSKPVTRALTLKHPELAQELADDMGFMRRMVAKIKLQHPEVDLKRVYVTGFSNGAEMAGRLAAEASYEVAAVHAGSSVVDEVIVRATATQTLRPLSLMHTIGSEDEEQKARMGFPDSPIPLDESLMSNRAINPAYYHSVVQHFAALLRLDPDVYTFDAPPMTGYPNGPTVSVASSRFTFSQTLVRGNMNTLTTRVIDGATHEYPNGKNHPVILAEEVWAFFSPHRLP